MCFARVEPAGREPVMSGPAAVAEIRPFVVADEVVAALRSGERTGLAAEAANADRWGRRVRLGVGVFVAMGRES